MKTQLALATLMIGLGAAAAHAGPNLVANGTFDALTNGNGQVNVQSNGTNNTSGSNTNPGSAISSAPGWTSVYTQDNQGSPFLFYTNNAVTTGMNDYWDNGKRYLWGATNGGTSTWDGTSQSAGGITGGGNFLVMDGGYHTTAISQAINGLVSGTTYSLSFLWAAAQWSDGSGNFATGNTTESVTAGIDGKTFTTDTYSLPSKGFSGWMAKTFTFTYTGGSTVLSFLANGTPAGFPPMTLLDSVSLASVPEPGTLALAGLAVTGAIALRRRRKLA